MFQAGALALAPGLLPAGLFSRTSPEPKVVPCGPGSTYVPTVRAAFVRRQGEYGMLWPGAVYDGDAALKKYSAEIAAAAQELKLSIDLRPEPIHSLAEAEAWLAEAGSQKPDGLLVILLDRQAHAWPTVTKAAASGLPTVVFAPLGAAFTTNTDPLDEKPGLFISSSLDFGETRFGLKMLRAKAMLREMRFLVIKGNRRFDQELAPFGTKLRYLPASTFLAEYEKTPDDDSIARISTTYLKSARRIHGAKKQDLRNGIRSYVVASRLLEREQADAITMDCLGALGPSKVSLPCIAWSRMLDQGIPAACEADLGACVTHALVQMLFDRPGFQQDPVPETARQCLIGAHCSCPTRLNGFGKAPEVFDIIHHHGNRDAVPRTEWPRGQRVTLMDVLLPKEANEESTAMVIGTGTVVDNLSVPPHGGCVVSVMVKLDTQPQLLSYPGFHQLFFFGDFKRELLACCQLFGIRPLVA